jgi:hypothetical protein
MIMKIIFLDFDGVMNNSTFLRKNPSAENASAEQVDPQAAALLDRLVQGTGAKIVISSSWRHSRKLSQIQQILRDAGCRVAHRAVLDRTPMGEGNRGQEIQDWLDLDPERQVVNPAHEDVQSYVILDDTNEMLPEQQPRLVQTNPQLGLTEQDVVEAISILRMGR